MPALAWGGVHASIPVDGSEGDPASGTTEGTGGVAGDETAGSEAAGGGPHALLSVRDLRGTPARWLGIFGASLAALLVRFLVPVPVGQADNRDGPRLMCGRPLGMEPVFPHGDPRFFRYAYFQYASSPLCHHRLPYPTSELGPLLAARVLTPVFGLPGQLNLIALGLLMCALASVGIASLATGLRMRLRAQVLMAAAIWVIIADAAFFDVFAGPFEEPAALAGLLLVAAGLVYLGRDKRATIFGLVLAGSGGFLAILSKEQYLILAVPICPAIVLASVSRNSSGLPWRQRFMTWQTRAASMIAVALAVLAGGYAYVDATSFYGQRLHHLQTIDAIFMNIVNGHDNARADLRALGLPQSWAKYAGKYYWANGSVRTDPRWHRYAAELTDTNVARFLLTHPGRLISIGQKAAIQAQRSRVTQLGTYPPGSGHRRGAYESRVVVVTWLLHQLPASLGLYWLIPLWLSMAAIALMALRRHRLPWHRDGALTALCLIGCAMVAFIPPAFFDGISATRHMVGTNLATDLSVVLGVALAVSMIAQAVTGARQRGTGTAAAPAAPAPSQPQSAR
jgi:hypothetical protein